MIQQFVHAAFAGLAGLAHAVWAAPVVAVVIAAAFLMTRSS